MTGWMDGRTELERRYWRRGKQWKLKGLSGPCKCPQTLDSICMHNRPQDRRTENQTDVGRHRQREVEGVEGRAGGCSVVVAAA